jgi:hypothetical protein
MPGSVQTCRVDYNRPLPQGPLSHPGYGRIVSPPHLAVPARGISGARRDAFWLSPFVPVESMTRGRQIVCMQIASHPIKIPRRIFTPREILLCTALLSCVAPRTMWAGRQELLAVLPLPESHPFFGQFALACQRVRHTRYIAPCVPRRSDDPNCALVESLDHQLFYTGSHLIPRTMLHASTVSRSRSRGAPEPRCGATRAASLTQCSKW